LFVYSQRMLSNAFPRLAILATLIGLVSTGGCAGTTEPGPDRSNTCGDGKVGGSEECDDGNTTPGDGCDASCKAEAGPACGDGNIEKDEECDDGNVVSGDGCDANCVHTPVKEVVCQNLAPLPQGTCDVKPGDGGRLIIGTVLAPDSILRGGQVLVDSK